MNKQHNYLTTGEFAKIMNVSKETLFHYDENGIFSPEHKAENGYRYYSVFQIEAFVVIRVLKEMGMPLKEIKQYLNSRSPERLIELLNRESTVLQSKIARLTEMKKFITKKAELTLSAMNKNFDEISVAARNKELYVTTDVGFIKTERAMMLKIAEHFSLLEKHGIHSPYAVGEMITVENVRRQNFGLADYLCYYTRVDKPVRGMKIHEKPRGHYLTAYHVGGYIGIEKCYARLMKYADENKLNLGAFVYEDVLLDELSAYGYDDYVLRLSVLVNKAQ